MDVLGLPSAAIGPREIGQSVPSIDRPRYAFFFFFLMLDTKQPLVVVHQLVNTGCLLRVYLAVYVHVEKRGKEHLKNQMEIVTRV